MRVRTPRHHISSGNPRGSGFGRRAYCVVLGPAVCSLVELVARPSVEVDTNDGVQGLVRVCVPHPQNETECAVLLSEYHGVAQHLYRPETVNHHLSTVHPGMVCKSA